MSTTDTLRHGTELVAEKTVDAATEIAERAKKQAELLVQAAESAADRLPGRKAKPRRRGRKVLGTLLALGAAGFAAMKGRKALQQRREQQQVLDLTLGDGTLTAQSSSATSRTTTP